MKKLILAAITTTGALSVLAQGTVAFSNRSAGGTTHVWTGGRLGQYQGNGANDVPIGSAVDYAGLGAHLIGTIGGGGGGLAEAQHTFAQLLGAPGSGAPESSLLPGAGVTTFRTGAAAGNIALITATFANIPPDAPVGTFEMVAWDNSSGLYPTWTQASIAWSQNVLSAGRSAPFVIQNIGGAVNTPPILNPGLQSFGFGAPEPSTVALAGLGAAALLISRRK
jgi:hypothetical protein